MINLSNGHDADIRRHGETEYPNECCGLLLGKLSSDGKKTVQELLPISNARETENRHNRFLITAEDLLRGELYARKRRLDIVGFYHSHPDHPAAPSSFDLEHAWPCYSYIIVAVDQGKSAGFTSWELDNDRSKFKPETITREGEE